MKLFLFVATGQVSVTKLPSDSWKKLLWAAPVALALIVVILIALHFWQRPFELWIQNIARQILGSREFHQKSDQSQKPDRPVGKYRYTKSRASGRDQHDSRKG